MKTVNFVLNGLGGQGILFMTKILAQAALNKGLQVMGAETHGMAQRGGSVVSHLRLGGVRSSLVRAGTAHFLLALEECEAYRGIPFLSNGGTIYASASDSFPRQGVAKYLEKKNITYRWVPATNIAMDLGSAMSSNLVLLGFFSAFEDSPLNNKDLRTTIDSLSPERFKDINLKVFEAGFQIGIEKKAAS